MFPQWVAKNTEFLPTGWEHQIKLKVANVTIMWSHNDSKLGQRNHVWYEIVLGRSLENTLTSKRIFSPESGIDLDQHVRSKRILLTFSHIAQYQSFNA